MRGREKRVPQQRICICELALLDDADVSARFPTEYFLFMIGFILPAYIISITS